MNNSIKRSSDDLFHLHCLENHERVAGSNVLTFLYENLYDLAGHRRVCALVARTTGLCRVLVEASHSLRPAERMNEEVISGLYYPVRELHTVEFYSNTAGPKREYSGARAPISGRHDVIVISKTSIRQFELVISYTELD